MRKIISIIAIFVAGFIGNLALYYGNEEYRFLLQKLKDPSGVVQDTIEVNDDYEVVVPSKQFEDREEEDTLDMVISDVVREDTEVFEPYQTIEIIPKDTEEVVIMSEGDNLILWAFSGFTLENQTKHAALFDLTTEYPDRYFEYFSSDLTLYFFPTKNYYDVKDIFTVLSYDMPFEINSVNNFWDKSFYINLDSDFDDGFVRLVVLYKNRVFWLKIKKVLYNDVKNLLLRLPETL